MNTKNGWLNGKMNGREPEWEDGSVNILINVQKKKEKIMILHCKATMGQEINREHESGIK